MEQQDLKAKAEHYEALKSEITSINKLVVPPFPIKPIACKAKEWNDYIKNKTEYDEAVEQKGTVLKQKEQELKDTKLELIKMLPASNVWFVLDDNSLAVGHQPDNCPSSYGDLFIVKNPNVSELKELTTRIIN